MSTPLFSAVLFDCDGILVDSEPITNRVQREMVRELGWDISEEEGIRRFVGHAFIEAAPAILEHTGRLIDHDWILQFRERRDAALRAELAPLRGVAEAVRAIAEALDGRVACVSGADRAKIEMQLGIAGLTDVFGPHVYSGMECELTKPAPDVYLAAAAALGIDPADCAVVEDSPSGVRAGLAAGATVFGFAPDEPTYQRPEALLELGVTAVFTSMDELPGLVLA